MAQEIRSIAAPRLERCESCPPEVSGEVAVCRSRDSPFWSMWKPEFSLDAVSAVSAFLCQMVPTEETYTE